MTTDIEPTVQCGFRLPATLVDALDLHVERLRKRSPGVRVTRSDALRVLLQRGLETFRGKP